MICINVGTSKMIVLTSSSFSMIVIRVLVLYSSNNALIVSLKGGYQTVGEQPSNAELKRLPLGRSPTIIRTFVNPTMTCSPPLATTEDPSSSNRTMLSVKLDNNMKRKGDFVRGDVQTRNKKARSTVILQETYRRRSAPPETAEASPRPTRRTSLPSLTNTNSNNNLQAPRWHSQAYLLFLALKQHPAKCLPRTELIRAALELDEKISEEYKLPRLFRGKVSENTNKDYSWIWESRVTMSKTYRDISSLCNHVLDTYELGICNTQQ